MTYKPWQATADELTAKLTKLFLDHPLSPIHTNECIASAKWTARSITVAKIKLDQRQAKIKRAKINTIRKQFEQCRLAGGK